MPRRPLVLPPFPPLAAVVALACLALAACGKQVHTSESPTSDALSAPPGSEQKAPEKPGALTPPPPPQPGQMRR